MTEHHAHNQRPPLVALRTWLRGLIALFLLLLAILHLLWPDVAIDAVFLGLLAFAALIWFFDVDAIEWQGIRARSRQIASAHAGLKSEPPIQEAPEVKVPKLPAAGQVITAGSTDGAKRKPKTVHGRPTQLFPPTDPMERLLWGTEQIRAELIVLLGNAGALLEIAPWSEYALAGLAESAKECQLIGPKAYEAVSTVSRMRSLAVHSRILDPTADLAMDVIQTLRAVPREYRRVRHHHISLFRDQSLTTPHDTHGVMTVGVNEDGEILVVQVFPREADYVTGRFTTWNWNKDRVFRDEAWYEDPDNGIATLAWSESATFAGREYPEQWGLQYRLPRPDVGLEGSS